MDNREAMIEQGVVAETPSLEHMEMTTSPSTDTSTPQTERMAFKLPETISQKILQDF